MDKANPPHYDSVRLEDVMNQYVGDKLTDSPTTEAQKERLRTFLVYCLGVEYRVDKVTEVARPDWTYFVWLSGFLGIWYQWPGVIPGKEQEYCRVRDFFDMHLRQPCNLLNVPYSAVGAKIRLFTLGRNFYGRLTLANRYYWLRDPGFLAGKLVVDRDIILPAILANPEDTLRGDLETAIQAESARWFTSLQSPDEFELNAKALRLHYDAKQAKLAHEQWKPSAYDLKMMKIWSNKIRKTEWKYPFDSLGQGSEKKTSQWLTWWKGTRSESQSSSAKSVRKEPPFSADLVPSDGETLTVTVTSSKGRQVLRYESAKRLYLCEC